MGVWAKDLLFSLTGSPVCMAGSQCDVPIENRVNLYSGSQLGDKCEPNGDLCVEKWGLWVPV